MYLLRRLLYALIESSLLVAAAGVVIRLAKRLGDRPASWLTGKLGGLVRLPYGQRGWYNLHFSRFRWRAMRAAARARERPQRSPRPDRVPRRIGCFGPFGTLLRFTRRLFEGLPKDNELHVYDLEYPGAPFAGYLEEMAAGYHRLVRSTNPAYRQSVERIADLVNHADLDLLLTASHGQEASDFLDRVETPCIVHVCTGSDLFHHPKVSFQMYGQPEADYFIEGRHIFCATTRSRFSDQLVFPDLRFHDPRGIDSTSVPSWPEREPLIVCHGSLFKMASGGFTSCLLDLLEDDAAVELVLAGKDDGVSLSRIVGLARGRGLSARVHYLGHLELPERGARPGEEGPDWQRLAQYLFRARLAPDPWPIGSGCARFEAYAAGAPSPHMGVRFERQAWGGRQHALLEVLALLIPETTVTTPEEYRRLCQRCLYEESFATRVVELQFEAVARSSDATAWWLRLRDCYQDWLTGKAVRP